MSMIRKYTIEQKVWLMSDLHIAHDKEFVYEKRGFQSIEEHNQTLIENIKARVGENDDFYILGDLTLGDLDAAAAYLRQIPGRVHIILGNHDTERRIQFYLSLGWDVQFATIIRWGQYRFYLSHYPTSTTNPGEDKLSLATINIYGHTHQNWNWTVDNSFAYCVCPEANDNCPIAIETIIERMRSLITFFESVQKVSTTIEEANESLTKLGEMMSNYTQATEAFQRSFPQEEE
jgi:calcineurin-like phosphoesterase family protein